MAPVIAHAIGVAGKRARSIEAVKTLLATTKNPEVAADCRATLAILESLCAGLHVVTVDGLD